jgi:predicted MFS family arabinose efflux permease
MLPPTLRSTLRLLVSRRFGTFLVASLLSNIGAWAQQVAEPWLLLTLGASSWLIGLDGFALNAPVWALTLVGGVLADRRDRRRVIVVFQSLQMLCPLLLLVLLWAHRVQPWEVIALSLGVGITDALSMPAFTSIVPSIVEPAQLGGAFALNSTQFNLSRILGPALAGVLLASWGAEACFGVNVLSYVPFIAVALWILPRGDRALPPGSRETPRQIFAGLAKVLRHPERRAALATVAVTSVLCGPLITFCPVLVKEVFHRGASELGGAFSAFGLGGVAGALALVAAEGSVIDRRKVASNFAMLNAVVMIGAALNTSLVGLLGLLAIAGAAMTLSNTALNIFLQGAAEETLRGQTASLYMLAMRGGLALGNLFSGASISWLGIRSALVADAVLALALQLGLRRWAATVPAS